MSERLKILESFLRRRIKIDGKCRYFRMLRLHIEEDDIVIELDKIRSIFPREFTYTDKTVTVS